MVKSDIVKRIAVEMDGLSDVHEALKTTPEVFVGEATVREKQREIVDFVLTQFVEEMKDALVAGEKVTIANFAGFSPYETASTYRYNFQTGETRMVEPQKRVKVKISKDILNSMNGK